MRLKVIHYISTLSPRRLAIYLVLGSSVWSFIYVTSTIAISFFLEESIIDGAIATLALGTLFLLLTSIVLLWLAWLCSAVLGVKEQDLGLPRRWFYVSIGVFVFNILYNSLHFLIENISEEYQYIFYAPAEFISFAGLLIAYPLLCHYAARGVCVKKTNEAATFLKTLPLTIFLMGGVILGVPFAHKHLSVRTSSNADIVRVYGMALGLFFVLLVVGFLASVTGFA